MASKREILNQRRLELIKARAAARANPSNDNVTEPVMEVDSTEPDSVEPEGEILPIEAVAPALAVPDGPRMARIYGRPINVRMRLIEFEDGSHGKLWVRPDSAPMLSWKVWVKPSPNVKGDWELHGRYNARGTRLQ